MAESSGFTIQVTDYQFEACKTFFKDELPGGEFKLIAKKDRPDNMKEFKGPIFDITGFDAQQVVAVLSDIVNKKCPYYPWENNKNFYLWIRSKHSKASQIWQANFGALFRLKARPTKDEPGNAIVKLRPRGQTNFEGSAKTYENLNGALKAHYATEDFATDTTSFAKHIKKLFKNNAQIDDIPQATMLAYMILLFEIARRLVTTENPSERKEELDGLPIGSAIARLVKLLELCKCSFEDVFLPQGTFHCFTGKPEARRQAIDNINDAILAELQTTKKNHLNELQELLCSEKQPEQQEDDDKDPQADELDGPTKSIDSQQLLPEAPCNAFSVSSPGEIPHNNNKRFSFRACLESLCCCCCYEVSGLSNDRNKKSINT